MTLTTTTTTNKMPTTAATTVNAQKRQPICKWSGSDIEPEYHPEYEESSDIEPEYPEYEESGANFTFGVCCDCDVGLYDKSEFVCPSGANGSNAKMCNACHNYHINLHIGGEHGGCN